jgi:hypothetical protein
VQLGLKGLHSHQTILVRENRHEEESLEAQGVGPPPTTTSSSSSSVPARSKLSVYLDSGNVTSYEDDFDILLWWRDHKLTYPVLSIMTKDITTVPVFTISLESCFSLSGRIIEERR